MASPIGRSTPSAVATPDVAITETGFERISTNETAFHGQMYQMTQTIRPSFSHLLELTAIDLYILSHLSVITQVPSHVSVSRYRTLQLQLERSPPKARAAARSQHRLIN